MIDLEAHKKRVKELAIKYIEEYNWILVPTYIGSASSIIKYKHWRLPPEHPEYAPPPSQDEMLSWFEDNWPYDVDRQKAYQYFDIAAVTGSFSGIVVVDTDSKEAATQARLLGYTSPVVVQTKKGFHYYWNHDPATDIRNRVGNAPSKRGDWPAVPGLDLRGDGGIIRLPPSYNSDMVYQYTWVSDFDEILDDPEYFWKPIARNTFLPKGSEQSSKRKTGARGNVYYLDLSRVKENSDSVIEKIEGGMPVQPGSRNHTVTSIVGELVAQRYPLAEIETRVHEIMALPNWTDPLGEEEVARTIESIVARDKSQNPDKWDGDNYREIVDVEVKEPSQTNYETKLQPLITGARLKELREQIGDQKFLMYPALTLPSIMQIYGYSGHGKSLFTAHMLYAACIGKDFGVFENRKKTRVLYLDFENSLNEILERMEALRQIHPNYDDSGFAVYSPAMKDGTVLTLDNERGFAEVVANAENHKAEVIVIDTYRTAFSGFSENDSHQWAIINNAILSLRNLGYAVIGLHHANKVTSTQSSKGTVTTMGSEAGSTAQLNLLEVQMRITQIFPNTDAGAEAAEETRGLVDEVGWDAIQKAKSKREITYNEEYHIRTAVKITYGKVRNRTPAHRTSYLGFAEAEDGTPVVIGSTPLRKRVQYLWKTKTPTKLIAEEYNLPMHLVEEYIDEIDEKALAGETVLFNSSD